ncbi:EscS/YscS/HrcS family type III secretion system export apparatus protein [Shewanella psychropiezotolerans]|uniref:Type III secretion protein, HrpO family n=2 Tax=Shewanella TaxID=22 RepID=A0A1S6HYQ8_9GAMM|nr:MULTISPECIES: type III secretion system export apparatus subunit SctS [Shewanella]AQS40639.1 type III secretion protein, HrpO family [Shewanella psychrophila]MPY25663.1 EscS/YscS/HrcS family type III secretion system export apparatus protein [Shewanella sp. YLB-07]QDO86366.1 EscS/YscS/HrcS family type III secretion system export apparatus protein [Shewanella psychropiezotolerans]
MEVSEVIHFTSQTLMLVMMLSMPPILAAAIVGTLVSLVQALTQIQEQTLGFVAKLIAVIVALFATASWLGSELYNFADMIFAKIPLIP